MSVPLYPPFPPCSNESGLPVCGLGPWIAWALHASFRQRKWTTGHPLHELYGAVYVVRSLSCHLVQWERVQQSHWSGLLASLPMRKRAHVSLVRPIDISSNEIIDLYKFSLFRSRAPRKSSNETRGLIFTGFIGQFRCQVVQWDTNTDIFTSSHWSMVRSSATRKSSNETRGLIATGLIGQFWCQVVQ